MRVETLEVEVKQTGATQAAAGMKNLAVQATAAFAAYKIGARILSDVYNAVVDQDTANRKLTASIKASGQEVHTTFKRFEEFAAEVQGLTAVADDVTLSLLSQATAMGLDADAAEEATKAAIALSDTFGISLTSALKMSSMAAVGNYEMLSRLIPALRTTTDESEKAAIVQGVLNDAWEIASQNTSTLEGAVDNLKNTYGDLIEAIVNASIDMEATISMINKLSTAFTDLASDERLGKAIKALRIFNEYVMLAINPTWKLVQAVRSLFQTAEEVDPWAAMNAWGAGQTKILPEVADGTETVTETIVEQEKAASALVKTYIDLGDAYADNLIAYIESQQQIAAYEQAAHNETMLRIEKEKQARIEAAEMMYGQLKSIVQQYYSNEIAAAGDNEEKLAEIREKQFKANQAFGIADTIINTAASIMKVLAQGGIFAIPIAAAMGALGAAQIAMIASAKPSFADGTPPGGYTVPPGYNDDSFPVSAKSGETVNISRAGESGSGTQIVIMLDSQVLANVTTDLIANRKIVIRQGDLVA
ncbi:MAG: hypothetical protein DRI69_01885 [Bacteroidetes bacterium]|nr:MAG: hypothetical protein DRI69_01885 [Bacteroidota bacterium]